MKNRIRKSLPKTLANCYAVGLLFSIMAALEDTKEVMTATWIIGAVLLGIGLIGTIYLTLSETK